MKMLRDPLFWLIALFVALIFRLPYSQPLFAALFPTATTRLSARKFCSSGTGSFLAGGNFEFVCGDHWHWCRNCSHLPVGRGKSSPTGGNDRRLSAFPARRSVSCAIAVPVIGFGLQPAIIALILYGVLPVLQATLAGLGAIDASVSRSCARMGMSRGQRLRKVELPLAAPVILAGVRTSVIITLVRRRSPQR